MLLWHEFVAWNRNAVTPILVAKEIGCWHLLIYTSLVYYSDFISLVVMPFFFLGRIDCNVSTAGGPFVSFSWTKSPRSFTLRHPTSEITPPYEEKPSITYRHINTPAGKRVVVRPVNGMNKERFETFPLWTDHFLDHLVPHLPVWEVVQDLHSTDPTHETCATAVEHADCTGPTRQHELDHTRSGIYLI